MERSTTPDSIVLLIAVASIQLTIHHAGYTVGVFSLISKINRITLEYDRYEILQIDTNALVTQRKCFVFITRKL